MATSEEKLARELRGPGTVEIILSVVLSLTLGVALGAAHLVFKPVEKKTGKETAGTAPAPTSVLYDQVQFIEGATGGGATWRNKQQAFVSGQPGGITLNESELNALVAEFMAKPPPPPAPPKPAAPSPTPAKPGAPADKPKDAKDAAPAGKPAAPAFVAAQLAPGVVNFRVRGGVLQVALGGSFNALGLELTPLVQMRGGFAKGADGFEFQPAEFYVGSLPVHKIPGLSSWLLKKMVAAQKGPPEDLKGAWRKLGSVAVEGDAVRLSAP